LSVARVATSGRFVDVVDMAPTVPLSPDARHRLLSDVPVRMAKADASDVRKADHDADDALRRAIGRAIRQVRGALTLKEFAALVQRDERQVSRWEDGKERPHFDALFAVAALSGPLVVALAALSADIEVTQHVVIRRRA